MSYDIVESIDAIFNAVDGLREISELTGQLYISVQMIDPAYMVISKLLVFRFDVCHWLRCAHVQQTHGISLTHSLRLTKSCTRLKYQLIRLGSNL